MRSRQKKPKDSDYYESYEKFLEDYREFKREENKYAEIIIRQNKRDLALLRRRLAMER
jgi:hypothetical protein